MSNPTVAKLSEIEVRVINLEKLTSRQMEIAEQQVRLTERQIAAGERFEQYQRNTDRRIDTLEIKVDGNHTSILKWSGGVAAVIGLVSVLAATVAVYDRFTVAAPARSQQHSQSHKTAAPD